MKRKKRKLLLIFWIIVMVSLSSRPATVSAQDSKSFEESFSTLRNELKARESWFAELNVLNMSPKFVVRKSAHIFLYAGLTLLLIFVNVSEWQRYRTYVITVVLATLYACADEFYQTFIPGRTGLPSDVLIDSIGIWLGVVLGILIIEAGLKKKKPMILRLIEN